MVVGLVTMTKICKVGEDACVNLAFIAKKYLKILAQSFPKAKEQNFLSCLDVFQLMPVSLSWPQPAHYGESTDLTF